MTTLEIYFTIIIWVIVGVWISYKRKWYPKEKDGDRHAAMVFNVILAPALVITSIMDVYILRQWKR